jgi:hypothetical protein
LTMIGNDCYIAPMKVVTKNISLSEDLANFALQEAEEGGYGSVSAYFAEMIRQRRQAQIEADVKMISDAMRNALPGPEPLEVITKATKAARRQMRKEKWREP